MRELNPDDAAAFARLAAELQAEVNADQTLQKVVDLAVATIPGVDYAGITMTLHHSLESPATTDPLVVELDAAQHRMRQGPCVDSARHEELFVIQDMTTEERWPEWTPLAAAAGVLSAVSVQLVSPQQKVGALNLFSKTLNAFDDEAIVTSQIYGMHASNALAAAFEAEGLQSALRTRHLIGLAQGMLMVRYGLSEDQSFQFLRRTSQDENVKLREVADRVIQELGKHRWPST